MRTWPVLLILLSACGPTEEPATKVWYAYDYSPAFGDTFTYVDPGSTATEPVYMQVGNGKWDFNQGADFDTGTPFASFVVTVEDDIGLSADGFVILPDGFVEGDEFDNGTVDSIAEGTVAIGTYSEMIRVTVDAGPLAGPAAFVLGVGPVQLTIDGVSWEASETGSL